MRCPSDVKEGVEDAALSPGEFVVVDNKPYKHPASNDNYIATLGTIRYKRFKMFTPLLFTKHEIKRAMARALKNREDVPSRRRDSWLQRLAKAFG